MHWNVLYISKNVFMFILPGFIYRKTFQYELNAIYSIAAHLKIFIEVNCCTSFIYLLAQVSS